MIIFYLEENWFCRAQNKSERISGGPDIYMLPGWADTKFWQKIRDLRSKHDLMVSLIRSCESVHLAQKQVIIKNRGNLALRPHSADVDMITINTQL